MRGKKKEGKKEPLLNFFQAKRQKKGKKGVSYNASTYFPKAFLIG